MRIIDQLENGTDRAIRRAKRLKLQGYDQDQLGEVARDAAAVWERMLKASDPSWTNKTLNQSTEVLRLAGWSNAAAELHLIRGNANSDKHHPNPLHDVDQLIAGLKVIKAPGLPDDLCPRCGDRTSRTVTPQANGLRCL